MYLVLTNCTQLLLCHFFFFLSLREINLFILVTLLYHVVPSSFYSCYYSAYNYRQFSYVSCLSYVYTRYVSFALLSLVTRDQLMLLWYYCLTIVLLIGLSIRQFKEGSLIITRSSLLINLNSNNYVIITVTVFI